MGNLIMPKNSAEVNEMTAVLKIYYDADGWIDNETLIEQLKLSLGQPFQEQQAYTKKTQIPAYFGFIIWEDLLNQRSRRKITESGKRFYMGLIEKKDKVVFKEIIYSLENQTFGRNVYGVNSDSDIEPPQIFIHCALALKYLTRQEYGFILWRLDEFNDKISDLLTLIVNNRTKITRYPNIPPKYGDAKPITALVNWNFLKLKGKANNQDKIVINADVETQYLNNLKNLKIFNDQIAYKKIIRSAGIESNEWTREESIIAFDLYCQIPFEKIASVHPDIINTAHIIGRTPSEVALRLANFSSLDPELKRKGISGLTNASKLDKKIWNEFNENWENLTFESLKLQKKISKQPVEEITSLNFDDIPEGKERKSIVNTRIGQNKFRKLVLAAYNSTCCITGNRIPELLISSHIIPWSKDKKNRINPANGLCLNVFHDKAFDIGLITITPDFCIKVSEIILEKYKDDMTINLLKFFHTKKINLPAKHSPDREFLEYHNQYIFEKN